MADLIKLYGGDTAPPDLAVGQLALSESSRTLYALTFRGILPIPLDRMALAPNDTNASSEAYVFRASGTAEIVQLSAGGGAPDRYAQQWSVPGMAPTAIGSTTTRVSANFEITKPVTLTKMRARVLSGTGEVTLTLYNADATGLTIGQIHSEDATVSAAGELTFDLNLSLDPGIYQTEATINSGDVALETISGYLPWSISPVTHAISVLYI